MVHGASMVHGPSMVHGGASSIHGPGRGCHDVEAEREVFWGEVLVAMYLDDFALILDVFG